MLFEKLLGQCLTLVLSCGEVVFAMGSNRQRNREHDLSYSGPVDTKV